MYKFYAVEHLSHHGSYRGKGRDNIVFCPGHGRPAQFPAGIGPFFFNRRMLLTGTPLSFSSRYSNPPIISMLWVQPASGDYRVANECGIPVTINDRDPVAIDLISRNVERSRFPVTVIQRDANALLSEQSFDAVDLDPFGHRRRSSMRA